METVGKIFTTLLLTVIGVLVEGLMIMKAFNWFIAPLTVGGEYSLSYKDSMGVALAIAILTAKYKKSEEDEEFGDTVAKWVVTVILKFLILFIAWIGYLLIY